MLKSYLALQICQLDLVIVNQSQVANTCGAQVEGHRTTQAASANNQYVGGFEFFLAGDVEPGHQDLPAVAEEFFVAEHSCSRYWSLAGFLARVMRSLPP